MRILICGDMHGNWPVLTNLLHEKRSDLVLQCGDFGYFPHLEVPAINMGHSPKSGLERRYDPDGRIANVIDGRRVPIHWVEGNHEDHHALRARREKGDFEVAPGIIWQPRGSTLTLLDGRIVLFMGGAKSVDWKLRKPGVSWFPKEILTEEDVAHLPERVDIVISHTMPNEFCFFRVDERRARELGWDLSPDSSRELLSRVLRKWRPRLWFCGHFHQFLQGEHLGCRWTALPEAPRDGWWIWLPDARRGHWDGEGDS